MKFLPSNSKINIFYTILLFVAQFAFGFYSNTISACLVDLRFVYHATLNQISYITIPAGMGWLIGSWANYSYKWVNRQLTLFSLLFISCILIGLLPHYGSLWLAFGAIFINGIGGGAYESAINVWLIEMWPTGNSAILQGVAFMYGIGGITAPLLAAPYVHGESNVTRGNETLTTEERIHDLTMPFAVGSVMEVSVQLIFLLLFFTNRYQQPSSQNQDSVSKNPQESSFTEIPNRTLKIALCGLAISTHTSAEIGYASFSTAMYQYLDIALTAQQAAHVLSILSTASTLGRLLTTIVSVKLVPDIVIAYHYVTILAGLSVLFVGRNSLTAIYVGTAILGYGYSAMTPGLYAFTERHLRFTDRVASFYAFLGAFISLITPAVLGQMFRSYPMVLFILEFGFYSVSLGSFVLLWLWIRVSQQNVPQNIVELGKNEILQ